jgi:hypothetical protein
MSCRANVDMKVMYDNILCLIYCTKYCTKSEVRSESMRKTLKEIIRIEEDDMDIKTMLKKAVMKF